MKKEYPYPPGEGKVKWVSTRWLGDRLKDEDLTVLDVQPNVHDYIMGHIPQAVYLNEGVLRAARRRQPAAFVSPEAVEPVFRNMGLRPEVPAVVYTGAGPYSRCTAGLGEGLEQTMVAYSLARYGHDHVYVLDGGLEKWIEEKRPLTKVFPALKRSEFKAKVRRDYFIGYEELKAIKDREDVILFDARPTPYYEGSAMWPKPGHIPGALSLPWKSLMDDKNSRLLKTDREIQAVLSNFDITRNKIIICYCGTGREATNEFILFKWYLGYPKVRIYEGSFTEWTTYPENPTATGPHPG